jgi:hypothetical protein
MHHEEQIIRSFIVRRKRERYLAFTSSPATRTKFTHALAHFKDLDPECIRPIPVSDQNPIGTRRILEAKGAPALCYVISEHPEHDGREFRLEAALNIFIGSGMGAILSCIPGALAYMETGERRFILEKEKAPLRASPCIRFRTRLIDPDSKFKEGIFVAAFRLRDSGDMPRGLRDELQTLLQWFADNLPEPPPLAHDRNKTAISWFKSESNDCISRVWAMVHLLEENGVVIDKITAERPGHVIYEDKWQVVAHPFGVLR